MKVLTQGYTMQPFSGCTTKLHRVKPKFRGKECSCKSDRGCLTPFDKLRASSRDAEKGFNLGVKRGFYKDDIFHHPFVTHFWNVTH